MLKEKIFLVNREEILAYMGRNRLTHTEMASRLNLTKQAFDKKLYKKTGFTESEIAKLRDMGCLFLNDVVPKNET